MKTSGIILLAIGIIATLGNIVQLSEGKSPTGAGIAFIVLGAYLIYRANQKKEEAEKKKEWDNNTDTNN